MKWFLLGVGGVVLLGVLLFGGLIFVMMGGMGMVSAWSAVRNRTFRADTWVDAGNSVRVKLPRGFEPVPRMATEAVSREAMPYLNFSGERGVAFEAALGRYTPINNTADSGRARVVIGEVKLDERWQAEGEREGVRAYRWSEGPGFAVTDGARRRQVEFRPAAELYTAAQMEQIAREALASITVDERALEALFAKRAEWAGAQTKRKQEALAYLAETVKEPDVVWYPPEAEQSFAILYAYLGTVTPEEFAGLRENAMVTDAAIRQPHTQNGLCAFTWREGRMVEWRVLPATNPVDPGAEVAADLEKLLRAKTPAGGVSVWRRGASQSFADSGTAWLRAWWADTARLRSAGAPAWTVAK
jgi:hypothetical protein